MHPFKITFSVEKIVRAFSLIKAAEIAGELLKQLPIGATVHRIIETRQPLAEESK